MLYAFHRAENFSVCQQHHYTTFLIIKALHLVLNIYYKHENLRWKNRISKKSTIYVEGCQARHIPAGKLKFSVRSFQYVINERWKFELTGSTLAGVIQNQTVYGNFWPPLYIHFSFSSQIYLLSIHFTPSPLHHPFRIHFSNSTFDNFIAWASTSLESARKRSKSSTATWH